MRKGVAGALIMLAAAAPLAAQNGHAPTASDLFHSDVPLFGAETGAKWPQPLTSNDEIGCTSRVAFGTWKYRLSNSRGSDDDTWYRIANYGAFHCFALVSRSDSRAKVSTTETQPAFFVLLGALHGNELWALQLGARPGSDYLLLARKADPGIIRRFTVLQRACPSSFRRGVRSLEGLLTNYCAIPSRAALISLARTMAGRPPLATLTLMEADTSAE